MVGGNLAIVTLIAGDTKTKDCYANPTGADWDFADGNQELKRSENKNGHVRLPGGIHKKVRIRAAEADQTIQDWVLQAIQNELKLSESKSGVDKADK